MPRIRQIQNFLKLDQLCLSEFEMIARDMSSRQYYRHQSKPLILMDCTPQDKPDAFAFLSTLLNTHHLRAPRVLSAQIEDGLMLLEDFGHHTFTHLFEHQQQKPEAYFLGATDVLIHLHKSVTDNPGILPYSKDEFLKEALVFLDFYWPHVKNVDASHDARQSYIQIWTDLLNALPTMPQAVVLRDYHVDNLMYLENEKGLQQYGLLDFQDALWGPCVYDVISLIEDARFDISLELYQACWQRFLASHPMEMQDHLWAGAQILAANRHLKVLGVFTRFYRRNQNDSKLIHLPRLWRYVRKNTQEPILEPLRLWLNEYFEAYMRGEDS